MPTEEEVMNLVREIDINKLNCVENIRARFCKGAMLSIPDVICQIMTKSFISGTIPLDWTKGVINVIPKGGDLTDPGNWRSITQMSIFAKILEKLVYKRLLRYLLNNRIPSDYQFVFLPGRSTQLAIFQLPKQIYSSFNNEKVFGSICLDVSKAFDCIYHVKLIEKMASCGISDSVLKWFKCFFTRTQSVRSNDIISSIKRVYTGIGQGTILGPLFYVLYINDVTHNIAYLLINMNAYDCLIYTIGNNWNLMFPSIQDGLNAIQQWFIENSLKLNVSKTKALILGTHHKTACIDLS